MFSWASRHRPLVQAVYDYASLPTAKMIKSRLARLNRWEYPYHPAGREPTRKVSVRTRGAVAIRDQHPLHCLHIDQWDTPGRAVFRALLQGDLLQGAVEGTSESYSSMLHILDTMQLEVIGEGLGAMQPSTQSLAARTRVYWGRERTPAAVSCVERYLRERNPHAPVLLVTDRIRTLGSPDALYQEYVQLRERAGYNMVC